MRGARKQFGASGQAGLFQQPHDLAGRRRDNLDLGARRGGAPLGARDGPGTSRREGNGRAQIDHQDLDTPVDDGQS